MFSPWHPNPSSNLLASYCETLGYMKLRTQREKALEIARIEAELASKTKSEFLANMSHELRTPLNAIIGFSELMQHLGSNAGKNTEYASNIADAGRHLLNVISDILDISKIESGTATFDFNRHRLSELVETSVTLVSERIAQKAQRLDVEIAPDMPALIVDGRRIRQILINLLSNANKYTPAGGRIAIKACRSAEGGVQISVSDTGPGLDEDEIQIAMTPFGQVRPHVLQSHGGTGLGLPIASALAKQHGGELQMTSVVGEGTSVTIVLPVTCIDRSGQAAALSKSASMQIGLRQ
ncbi:MAG TPA: ATP-binding protein [Rhizomicrobium sp.]|jgi:two-component system cell cycle sensor histidine kinase PleC|nr:ATP-binding protein [Rhizomicrobium sp.]